jgi:hypothetical protein
MAVSPDRITVTNDYLAGEIIAAGKKLIDLGMSLQQGFDVEVSYEKENS